MKKVITKYGLIACAIVIGIPVLSMAITGFGPESFDLGAIIGYSSMIVAMGLIYFAIRNHRDKHNGGIVSFGEGMKIGLAISTMGGIVWGIYNLIFVTWIMPDFYEQYVSHSSGLEIGTQEFERHFNETMEANSFFYSDFGGTLLMFLTVFLIGFVISIISALVLQKRVGTVQT